MIFFEFRVHGIQSYIFATNRLKEMVGASALIDQLTEHDIQNAIKILGLGITTCDFARRAGGAFLVQIRDPEHAYKLRDFWLMFVSLKIPGLSFSYALHAAARFDADARAALAKKLQANRCHAVPAPNAGSPFAERAPLTGLPAVTLNKGRLLDETSLAKRNAGDGGGYLEAKLKFGRENLTFPLSFVPTKDPEPVDTLLAESETDQYVAVIHADANGLGKIVDEVYRAVETRPELFPELPFKFSRAVEVATHKAVIEASTEIVNNWRESKKAPHKMLVPMRFLVLGGDDVTLVTKAQDALGWVKTFQGAFQKHAHEALKPFAKHRVPTQLTASAGVAFIKAKQPFHMAYHLAESLCSAAKAAGRNEIDLNGFATPTVAFHRITTAMIDDWDLVVEREKTTRDGRVMTMQPYANNDACSTNLPTLSDLETLTDLIKQVGRGTVRELLKAFHQGREHTLKSERRLFENLNLSGSGKEVLENLKQTLSDLHVPQNAESLSLFDNGKPARTPLADAVAWDAIRVKEDKNQQTKKEGVA